MTKPAIIGFQTQFGEVEHIDQFDRVLFDAEAKAVYRSFSQKDLQDMLLSQCQQLDLDTKRTGLLMVSEQSWHPPEQFAYYQQLPSVTDALNLLHELPFKDCEAVILAACHNSDNDQFLDQQTFALDNTFDDYPTISGMACMVFANTQWANQQGYYTYASIEGMAVADTSQQAATQALTVAERAPEDIGVIELTAVDKRSVEEEYQGLVASYGNASSQSIALGAFRAVSGEGHAFSQLAGLIKSVISVYQCYFPGNKHWQSCCIEGDSPFYVSADSHPWYAKNRQRFAACHLVENNQITHIIIADNTSEKVRPNGYLTHSAEVLFLLSANDVSNLQKKLDDLNHPLDGINDVKDLAQTLFKQFDVKQALRLCLIASNVTELRQEIAQAKTGVEQAVSKNADWKTPKGSYFSANPQRDNVCFMYPGIGATYIGLGRSLFHLFPRLMPIMESMTDNLSESMKDNYLNPRSLDKIPFKQMKSLEHKLRNSLPDIAECGVAFACVYSAIFREVFKIIPAFAAGYSMGEVSMYAALDVWQEPARMSERLKNSVTFNQRLSGDLLALDDCWGTDSKADRQWETYSVRGQRDQVLEAMEGLNRVYCTIVNTPDNLLIAGHPEDCLIVIKRLGIKAMALDMPNAIHSPPAGNDYEAMVALYDLEVKQKIPTKIYSSSCYLPIPQFSKSIANSIAKCLCDPVDFPKLIETIYEKGARVFIEAGPGRSLSSWVDKILTDDQPHASLPVNAKGVSDELTLLRALAKLVSHGVEADLSTLFTGSLVAKRHQALTIKAKVS